MHPRNRFKDNKPDFGAYIQAHKSLEPYLIKRKRPSGQGFTHTLDFSDPEALRELTVACLKYEFDLDVIIPSGHLVPTVPQRLNYIHFVEDLLSNEKGDFPKGDDVMGIDIGTGASCVYPLLGATMNGWKFVATEIDKESFKCAHDNVSRNKLGEKINTIIVSPNDDLLMGVVRQDTAYDFCMCNPPFFKDKEDKRGSIGASLGHRPVPMTRNTGNESETITEGGEVEFVKRIISDSFRLKTKVRWYSTMLGKKSNLKQLKSLLDKHNVHVVTTEFCQGRTHRWAIAWTFALNGLSTSHVYKGTTGRKRLAPLSLPLKDFPATQEGLTIALERIRNILKDLQIVYEAISNHNLTCTASKNTWSHQRKRRRLKQRLEELKKDSAATSNELSGDPSQQKDRGKPVTENELLQELEQMLIPCSIVFSCCVSIEEYSSTDKTAIGAVSKRTLNDSSDSSSGSDSCIVLSMEWLEGSDRDHLHQIVQYFHNNISALD